MTAIIFISILVLAAIIGLIVGVLAKTTDARVGGFALLTIAGVLAIIVWLANSIVDVEKRTVGIVTEFGKPTATLDSGPHLIAPWAEVHRFPTTNQSIDLNGTDGGGPVVNFKFSGGGSGYANLNVVWQIENNEKAVKLWENWKEFDRVSSNVVYPTVIETTSAIIGAFDPSEAVKSENLVKFSDTIKNKLNERLSVDGIKIEKVNMIRVDPDNVIQDRVNRQVAAQADVERANTEREKARIDNQKDAERQQSLSGPALTLKCLEVTNAWDVHKNGTLPVGWNCFTNPSLVLGK